MASGAPEHLDGAEVLWRRVHHTQWVLDSTTGERRLSSGAFTDPDMSVDRAMVRAAEGHDHKVTQADAPAVASFAAPVAIDLGLHPVADPMPDNAAHALVLGHKSRPVQRALQRASAALT